ncbi:MAG: hypothetical protein V3V57_00680 [Spirochaetia bacterium]
MEEKAMIFMVEQRIVKDRVRFQRHADMRYQGQEHTVKVPIDSRLFDEFCFYESPVYERDLLPVEERLEDPLVIEEPASTTVVFPGQRVVRDRYGLLHIEMMNQ